MSNDQLNQQSAGQQNDPYFGGCPVCGGANGYMYERPGDLSDNASYGYHWTICATHRKKWDRERIFSSYLAMTDDELGWQYAELDTYEAVEGVYPAKSRLTKARDSWISWRYRLHHAWSALRGSQGLYLDREPADEDEVSF